MIINPIRSTVFTVLLAVGATAQAAAPSDPPREAALPAAEPAGLQLSGRWYGGPVYGSAVAGDYVYFGSGGAIRIMKTRSDASGIVDRVEVGKIGTSGIVRDLEISDGRLYVADDHGALHIYDISDAEKPVKIGSATMDKFVRAVAISGDHGYLATGWNGITVVDVSDPTQPRVVNRHSSIGYIVDMFAEGSMVLAADSRGGYLRLFDVENPKQISEIGAFQIPGVAHGVYARGDHAYIVSLERPENPGSGGLTVVDISNTAAPRFESFVPLIYGAERVQVDDRYAYLAAVANDAGLIVVDVSDPANPQRLGSYRHPTCSESVAVAGQIAFLAHGDMGLEIIDLSDPMQPYVQQNMQAAGHVRGLQVRDGYAFLANGYTGVRVVDVSDDTAPRDVGGIRTYRALDIRVHGDRAYVADDWAGLKILDISDPASPRMLGSIDTPGYAEGLDLLGDVVFIADGDGGLRIVLASSPEAPRELASIPSRGYAFDVVVAGKRAYVADGKAGLRIIDLANISVPRDLGGFSSDRRGFEARSVAVRGTLAFLASAYAGVIVLDVSDPQQPVEIGHFPSEGSARSIELAGNRAFVGKTKGVFTLDVSDPSRPALINGLRTPGNADRLWVDHGRVFVAAREAGMIVLDPGD